jgi:hypothetical protein
MMYYVFIMGILLGVSLSIIFNYIKNYRKELLIIKNYKDTFNSIKDSIGTDRFKFISRLNNICIFKFNDYDIIINIDNNEISLLKNNKVVMVSNDKISNKKVIEDGLRNEIVSTILVKIPDVSDLVALPGSIVDRKTFEKIANNVVIVDPMSGDTPKRKKKTFTLDSILDKINEVGLDGLTKEERKFLEDQSKK